MALTIVGAILLSHVGAIPTHIGASRIAPTIVQGSRTDTYHTRYCTGAFIVDWISAADRALL
jgi:hypothetical protein